MRIPFSLLALFVGVPGLLIGCSGPAALRPAAYPPACTVLPAPGPRPDTLTVAVRPDDAAMGPAGHPLVFRQLYETLVSVDCLGTVRPGLASAWRRADGGALWSFDVRTEARFSDGSPVTAPRVAAGWQEAVARSAAVDSVRASDAHTLHVYLPRPSDTVPLFLAGPDFAVTADARVPLPTGSGPFRPALPEASADETPVLQIVETASYDVRDLLDGPVDAAITRDPDVLHYAAQQPNLSTRPLPWDRTYVLLSAARARALAAGDPVDSVSIELLTGLARDAVRAEARAYEPSTSWAAPTNCIVQAPEGPVRTWPAAPSNRILYDANDPTARGLAERLVALASMDPAAFPEAATIAAALPDPQNGSTGTVATGVPQQELERRLLEGGDTAYVVALPKQPYDACDAPEAWARRIPWLAGLGERAAGAMLPLVDTRPHVIARTDRVGGVLDGFGNVIVYPR